MVLERSVRDSRTYSNEMKKLQRILDHQDHLNSFVNTITVGDQGGKSPQANVIQQKNGIAETFQSHRNAITRLHKIYEGTRRTSESENAEPSHTVATVMIGGDAVVQDTGSSKSATKTYHPKGRKDKDAANYEWVDKLLSNFSKIENDNHTMFEYVSGLNNEVGV